LPYQNQTYFTVFLITDSGARIKEGLVRVKELEVFLQTRKLPKFIWMSEDGTRITPRVQYDNIDGEIIGLSLPTAANGLPIVSHFKVNSANQMKEFMAKYESPSNLYVIMATAMSINSPNFCLCVFGTDNKFTGDIVVNRWNTIIKMLQLVGVEVVGVSSDGDSRLMKAMRIKSQIATDDVLTPIEWRKWYHARYMPELICVQDTIHIGGKLRMRLLNQTNAIIIGK
jgi:hypothetical protein